MYMKSSVNLIDIFNSTDIRQHTPLLALQGTLYWITGLAGAGKSTIGRRLYERLKEQKPNVVFLDGDVLRNIFANPLGHSLDDRKTLALIYSNLCRMLVDQQIDVVCATMSLFKEVHSYNRKHMRRYYEIFVDCQIEELIRRDQKGIYSSATSGQLQHVVGIDIPYDRPENCDLVIDNTAKDNLESKVDRIISLSVANTPQAGDEHATW